MPNSNTTRWTAIAAVAAVLVVIVGGALVALLVNDDGTTSSGASGETSTAPTECSEPPGLPASPPSFSAPPDKALAEGTTWKATVSTNCGDIVFELAGDKAPQAVASFIFLTNEHYWNDSPCHRLVTQGIFVLQCGDPTGTGTGGPGYAYGVENAPSDGSYPRGTLAMANTGAPNSNGSQFFVVFDDTQLPTEGGGYSIFGTVVSGMDIIDRIAAGGFTGSLPGEGPPLQPISILDVTLEKTP